MSVFLAIVLLGLAIGGIVVRKAYFSMPLRELKRRAEQHDRVAVQLYRAAAYGNSLRGLLWLYIGLTSAASLILLARTLPIWASLLIVGPLLWMAFSFIPATRLTGLGVRLTELVTPAAAWLLNYVHPVVNRATRLVEQRYVAGEHTQLFERDDLLELIERQQRQHDNRLSEEELEIARRALTFSDHTVGEIMTPRKQIKTVKADDTVGPVLIDELHKTGQEFALVKDSSKGAIIGTLSVDSLGIDSQGHVRDLMHGTVYYVHEDDNLSQALQAFFVTNHPLFVVVNNFEEYVGVVSVENILKHLLGHVPGDEFDQYSDLAAVAARHTKSIETETSDAAAVQTEEKVVE